MRVLVCITCYSEPIENLNKTIYPLRNSLKLFRGKAGIPWEDVAVCVKFDGCKPLSESVLRIKSRIKLQVFLLFSLFKKTLSCQEFSLCIPRPLFAFKRYGKLSLDLICS